MSKREFFGTDGIRGRVGVYPMTPDFVLKLGWAAGKVLGAKADGPMLIGKDTRISGYMFESALEAGLSAAGVDVKLLGPMPTPAIAYLTQTLRASAGIVISASHNPFYDNGIKFLSAEGQKLPDEIEEEIEEELRRAMNNEMDGIDSMNLGKAEKIEDARGRYIEFCKSTFPSNLNLHGMSIVVDCAHGAAYEVAPSVFSELGAEVIAIGDKPNGTNINDGVGATSTKRLKLAVLEHEADLGVALDGDADRIMMVDHKGEILDGDEIMFVIANHLKESGKECPGVVGTLMSNFGFELALKERGIDFVRANVGDRYVLQELQEKGWNLGGEPSGHVICMDKIKTGDGIVAALQALSVVQESQLSLYDLKQGMQKLPQVMINVPVKQRYNPNEVDSVVSAVAAAEDKLAGTGRVLLRASGTEPLIRVMVEGKDLSLVNELAKELAKEVEKAA